MLLWIIYFSIKAAIHKVKGTSAEEDIANINIYKMALSWHFSPESKIPNG
jgi:hypothetical protein